MPRTVIDAHIHLFQEGFLPPRWFEGVAQRWSGSVWPHRDPALVDIEGGIVDPGAEWMFAEMESAGLDGVICLGLDWGVALGQAPVHPRDVNAYYGKLQLDSPGRFNAVVGVDPRRPEAAEIIREGVQKHQLNGVKLYPPCGYYADDPVCDVVYEACRELNVPVIIHTAFIGYPHQGHFANPSHIATAQARFPDVTFVLAHSGHHFWLNEALAISASHPHTYLDISNWNELLDHDVDQLVRVVSRMRKEVGAHKMLFASDHLGGRRFGGKGNVERYIDFVTGLSERAHDQFSEEEIDMIMGQNSIRVFDLATGEDS